MSSRPTYDLLAIGETMAMLAPTTLVPLVEAVELRLDIGGAESNVAMHLARLGHPVAWASRVGNDPFGRRILDTLATAGVDTSSVTIDPDTRTGVYFKDSTGSVPSVHYYRTNSAASRMSADWLTGVPIPSARIVHVSGITPALSATCAGLLDAVIATAHRADVLVSFDVNYRPQLWPVEDAAPIMLALAEQADLVFAGRDEAELLWGTPTAADVRRLLPHPARLIVKDASVGATEFLGVQETFVAAPEVSVIESVGAGDAFAAGYLSAFLSDLDSGAALLHGHSLAASALQSMLDVPGKG
jgi:2-dehydro-3-deoxygluconokinase